MMKKLKSLFQKFSVAFSFYFLFFECLIYKLLTFGKVERMKLKGVTCRFLPLVEDGCILYLSDC